MLGCCWTDVVYMFIPFKEYSSCVWDPHTKSNISKLEMVQRRAARYTCNRFHNTSSVTNMLTELKWPQLDFEFTFRLRLIKLRYVLAVELMLSMCLFHLRSDWIVTPRYFVEDSVWRVCWWSMYLWCIGWYDQNWNTVAVYGTLIPNLTSVNSKWSNAERPDTPALYSMTPALSRTYLWCIGFFLVVMCMTEHLSGWNCISQSFSQLHDYSPIAEITKGGNSHCLLVVNRLRILARAMKKSED
jgi:hypothetical protein